MYYPHLLSPVTIGKVTLKNRISSPDASLHLLQGLRRSRGRLSCLGDPDGKELRLSGDVSLVQSHPAHHRHGRQRPLAQHVPRTDHALRKHAHLHARLGQAQPDGMVGQTTEEYNYYYIGGSGASIATRRTTTGT